MFPLLFTISRSRLASTGGDTPGRYTQVSHLNSAALHCKNTNIKCAVVEGSRSILFDLHSRIGLDFGILIAWGAVNTLFFPFCCWFMSKFFLHTAAASYTNIEQDGKHNTTSMNIGRSTKWDHFCVLQATKLWGSVRSCYHRSNAYIMILILMFASFSNLHFVLMPQHQCRSMMNV